VTSVTSSNGAAYINNAPAASTASSLHGSGVNLALADGSVHFVKNDISPAIWWSLGSIAGAVNGTLTPAELQRWRLRSIHKPARRRSSREDTSLDMVGGLPSDRNSADHDHLISHQSRSEMLHLVRHGESTFNAEGRIQGHSDVPLSERGCQQSQAVADALVDVLIEAVYSSPLRRAHETAQRIADVTAFRSASIHN